MGGGRSRCVCVRVREKVLKKIRTSSPWFFPRVSQATEINLFYANSIWAFSFICIFSFVFHLFASWNSLLQVIGFSIFLLCLSSWSKRHSDEVTESANSGTKTVIYTTDERFFLHWTPKRTAAGPVCAWRQRQRNLTCWLYCETFWILCIPFNCLIANSFSLIPVS